MAATATTSKSVKLASGFVLYTGTIALDSSYPTGGEAIDLGLNERVDFLVTSPSGGYVGLWDATNQKLLMYYGDNNNASDGALIQVPDTTDLSALTAIPFFAIGA
jgi:hypothetical protein